MTNLPPLTSDRGLLPGVQLAPINWRVAASVDGRYTCAWVDPHGSGRVITCGSMHGRETTAVAHVARLHRKEARNG
mgnify:CR=1 FL=1